MRRQIGFRCFVLIAGATGEETTMGSNLSAVIGRVASTAAVETFRDHLLCSVPQIICEVLAAGRKEARTPVDYGSLPRSTAMKTEASI